MTPSDKLREIAVKWCPWSEKTSFKRNGKDYVPFNQMVSDLTALISEGYVEKAKYDEAVRQRDELKAIIDRLIVWNKDYPANRIYSTDEAKLLENALTDIVEAAIKNTEG